MLTLEYWYLFPVAIVISSLAMTTGIGGAVFYSPIFLLVLKLEPTVAIGTALLTELFGFSSGLVGYVRARLIDYRLAKDLLIFAIPSAIVGVIIAPYFPAAVLMTIFAVGILFIGIQLFLSWRQEQKEKLDAEIKADGRKEFGTELIDSRGRVFRYTVCNKNIGRMFSSIGGCFLGMISVGLAELMEYQLVAKCKVPSAVAVATMIMVVVITVLVASIGHIIGFVMAGPEVIRQAAGIAMFTAPGVLIGGQIGPRIQAVANPDKMKVTIAILFVGVSLIMFATLAQQFI